MQGVIDLYTGLLHGKRDLVVHAYETWGFAGLSTELIERLNIWARFIYGPLLDDREREIADGTTPGQYGRKEAFTVHKALKEKGPVRVPREFVFMDRAAIGLGGVFLHLRARLNWHDMFNDTIRGFMLDEVGARQKAAFAAAGVPLPVAAEVCTHEWRKGWTIRPVRRRGAFSTHKQDRASASADHVRAPGNRRGDARASHLRLPKAPGVAKQGKIRVGIGGWTFEPGAAVLPKGCRMRAS